MRDAVAAPASGPAELWGHPRGLYVLFLTEMWERFSFYGMRALLIFYLTKHFLLADAEASRIYGGYLGMAYALPVIGGLLADRWLGLRKAVVFGAVLLCLGHFGMSYEGEGGLRTDAGIVPDRQGLQILHLSLALICVGVGFLKPSISALVGSLYPREDPRRDSGFTLFYMGINLGAFAASLIVGAVGEFYGWGYGFGLAGIGMLVGLATFLYGQRFLAGAAEPPDPALLRGKLAGLRREHWLYLGGLAMVLLTWQLLLRPQWVGYGLAGALGVACLLLGWHGLRHCDRRERDRLAVVLTLTFFSVVFWALFEQAGSSMNLFADRAVDRDFAGLFTIPAATLQSLNAGFILLLAPLFAALWARLARARREPSTPVKFSLGILQAGLGFGALALGALNAGEDRLVALGWIVLAYFLHTTGELCLSPIGLSMVTRLTLPSVTGLAMGTWFLATAFAEYLAGLIAVLVTATPAAAADPTASYAQVFGQLFLVGAVSGIVLLALAPKLSRMTHGLR
ncbi:MAG: oligopeptide:H+ symporter [Gammaproteobacteria bacterium]|nr:oligopeptide:H+ symporter [Gammaproteobacteria bacterium]MDD9824688.1 oligopeptide:H+ symporter [Gammaproteobacteria bacterium]MDD9863996.1 oligopeptide:H+ symporter [Gammaproteobacteria bacterium]